jgi:hypothetical protein
MSLGRRGVAVTLVAAATLVGGARPVGAQPSEAPANARLRFGPLALSPVVRLTNVGRDSNVFNLNQESDPKGDVTATAGSTVEAWLRLPRFAVSGRSQFDFYYFKKLSDLRALDSDNTARVELRLNRLTPYVAVMATSTRHRQNLEIDAVAKRRNKSVTAGADVRVGAKVSVGAYARTARLEYDANSLYLGTDLSRVLNYTSRAEGIGIRYVVTPFTTFTANVEQQRDRFEFSEIRNSDGSTVTTSVEFSPRALISGRASLGYRKSAFHSGDAPNFNGAVASGELLYTLLGRTRFAVGFRRQPSYSYIVERPEYVETAVGVSVTHRLGDAWDIGGSIDRGRLVYRQQGGRTLQPLIPSETVLTGGADVSYLTGRASVGFHVLHMARSTQALLPRRIRGYERFRIGSTLTYGF